MAAIPQKMNYMDNLLIPCPKRKAGSRTWIFFLVGLLLVRLLLIPPRSQGVAYVSREDPNVTSWLSKAKARQIMQYHGANAIRITENRVYILRNSRWIYVYQDPSFLPGEEDRRDTITMAVEVAATGPR